MDYSSYKTMCDTTLEQIRKSENKRQELDHKLQKMYQEKSECEKSIIKTLQSQHKQFEQEKRRRAERNESILRTLERIDYQASTLAAKTERLRALKKQYEKYLLSLWNSRRQAIYPIPNLSTTGPIPGRFVTKYDESSVHQSSFHGPQHKSNYPRFSNALQPYANFTAPAVAINYPHNQSYFQYLPSTKVENSITPSNYRTTGAVIESQFSYPSTYQVRYDDLTQTPQYQQSVEKKSFYHNDSPINNDDMNLPTTINSIYRQQQPPQFSTFDEKSTLHPIYQRNNQPLENHNFNSGNLKMSETFYGKQFIMPASTDPYVTQLSPQPTVLSATSSDMLLKTHSDKSPFNKTNTASVHISDCDEESDGGEKSNLTKRNNRVSETTFHHQMPFNETKGKVETSIKKPNDLHDETNIKHPQEETDAYFDMNRIKLQETRPINDSLANENMHQVWEKAVVDPVDIQHSSSFVIPKIIVETQIDLTETSPRVSIIGVNHSRVDWKSDKDSPEKLLNHEMKKRSTDDQQNETLSYGIPTASAVNNNLPLEEVGSSIYHYDKQPSSDEQQNHQKQPQSRVEHELRNFNEMEISKSSRNDYENAAATQSMTHESEIKTNNSLAEGSLDDGGVQGRKETINNINDDKNQSTSSTAAALTDKISEIYRKIGKIEDNYYDEKGKIIENFERRLLSTSLVGDGAKPDSQPIIDSLDVKYDVAEVIEPPLELEESILQEANQISAELQSNGNMIQGSVENDWKNEQLQSEIATEWNGVESQGDQQPNYNYGEYIENENQQNFVQQQNETILSSADDYSPQYQSEAQLQPQVDNRFDAGGGQIYPGEYPYEQTQQYQDYTVVDNNDPHQQQSDFVYSHPDNTQHYQQQQQQEANNYNPAQSDSNYQQNNYDETQEIPSNYTNDSAAVYYDYDQNQQQQQQQQLETSPHIMYDDQNYTHQQPAPYQSNEGEASQLFYENVDNDKAEMNSNVNNYGYTTEIQTLTGTSGDDGTLYNANEYQTEVSNNYDNGANLYDESQTIYEAPLENANFDSQQLEQRSNENYEQPTEESYERDESYLTTTTSSSSENSKPLETEAQMNVNRDVDESASVQPSKRDDIKLVKQLLDSESDDTTSRSNLLKTSIKEEADESDFDFSAG